MENNPDKVNLTIKGSGKFTAKNIQKASDQFEILNSDHYITELNKDTTLDIELRIGIGKGYVPAEENELPNAPVGTLAIDSFFNPVTVIGSFSINYFHFAIGGIDINIDSGLPPVCSPNFVPRSYNKLNSIYLPRFSS